MGLCPPGRADPAAAGWRRAEELPLDGGQGFDLPGRCPITFPGPGSGFQTRPRPRVLKCMCVYACPRVSGLRWGTRSRSTRGPFHLLPPVPRLLLAGGRPSPPVLCRVFSLPRSVSLLPPRPLLWSPVSSPNPSPHFLARPSDLSVATLPTSFVTSVGPLSPVPWHSWVSVSCSVRSGLSHWLHPLSPTPSQ